MSFDVPEAQANQIRQCDHDKAQLPPRDMWHVMLRWRWLTESDHQMMASEKRIRAQSCKNHTWAGPLSNVTRCWATDTWWMSYWKLNLLKIEHSESSDLVSWTAAECSAGSSLMDLELWIFILATFQVTVFQPFRVGPGQFLPRLQRMQKCTCLIQPAAPSCQWTH